MVLDPFGVEFRDFGVDADRDEEVIDDLVTFATFFGEGFAFFCQEN